MTTNGMLLNISVSSKKKEKETGYSKHLIRSSQSESRITHCADVFSWIKTKLGIYALDLTNTIIAKLSQQFQWTRYFHVLANQLQELSTAAIFLIVPVVSEEKIFPCFSQSATRPVHSGHVFYCPNSFRGDDIFHVLGNRLQVLSTAAMFLPYPDEIQ